MCRIRLRSAGKGACLDDAPSLGGYQFPDLPAGSMYDAEHQCRLQFGVDEAAVCSDMEEVRSRSSCARDIRSAKKAISTT